MAPEDASDRLSLMLDDEPPVLRVGGEIDAETSPEFRRALDGLRAASGTGPAVVDLGEVTFMDSSGLSALVNVAADGHAVVLRRPSTMVQRIVEMTGLGGVLQIEA